MLYFAILFVAFCIIYLTAAAAIMIKAYKMASDNDEVNRKFFTICDPNKIMIVMNGGNPNKFIANINGFNISESSGLLTPADGTSIGFKTDGSVNDESLAHFQETKAVQVRTGFFDYLMGMHWMGLPPMRHLHSMNSEWNDVKKVDTAGKPTKSTNFIPRKEMIASYSFMRPYGLVAVGMEMGSANVTPSTVRPDMVPVDIEVYVMIAIMNPYQALIMTNWLKGIEAIFIQVCTKYCSTHSLKELEADFGQTIIQELLKNNQEILAKYGVVIYDSRYNGYEFHGVDEEEKKSIIEASLTNWKASVAGDAVITTATKNQEAAVTNAKTLGIQARANAVKTLTEGRATIRIQKGVMQNYAILGENSGQAALAYGLEHTNATAVSLGGMPTLNTVQIPTGKKDTGVK